MSKASKASSGSSFTVLKSTRQIRFVDDVQRCDDQCCKNFQCAACLDADASRRRAEAAAKRSAATSNATSNIYAALGRDTLLPLPPPTAWSSRVSLPKAAAAAVPPVVAAAVPSIPVLPVDTQVFVPPLSLTSSGHGSRGHIESFNESLRMYTVVWAAGVRSQSRSGSVPQQNVFQYFGRTDSDVYPASALGLERRVACGVAGFHASVQGVVVNHDGVPIYYDVGPNTTGSNFVRAEQVVTLWHGLTGNFSDRMAQVGLLCMEVIAEHNARKSAAVAPAPAKSPVKETVVVVDLEQGDAPSEQLPPRPATPAKAKAAAPMPPPPATPAKVSSAKAAAAKAAKSSSPMPPPLAKAATRAHASSSDESGSSGDDDESHGSGSSAVADDDEGTGVQSKAKRAPNRKPHGSGRKRAAKFKLVDSDKETVAIFHQLSSEVPWAHSRQNQKECWGRHLHALWDEGHALELQGHKDAVKTFTAWAAHICKTRRKSRLAEMRKSGGASYEHDIIDDVAYRWEEKVCGDAANTEAAQERALLIRAMSTETAACLPDKKAAIEKTRARRYAAGKTRDTDTSPQSKSHKSSESPAVNSPDAKLIVLRDLHAMTQGSAEQDAKDTAFIENIVSRVFATQHGQQVPAASQPASAVACEVQLLTNFLQLEDSSLVAYADRIHAALGITEGAHFSELTEADIMQATAVPKLQLKRLLLVAKKYGLA